MVNANVLKFADKKVFARAQRLKRVCVCSELRIEIRDNNSAGKTRRQTGYISKLDYRPGPGLLAKRKRMRLISAAVRDNSPETFT